MLGSMAELSACGRLYDHGKALEEGRLYRTLMEKGESSPQVSAGDVFV